MDKFAERLRERAKQLGISNAEAARRVGLEERRYAHYAAGQREPDLTTLCHIALELQTTPNWLLGVPDSEARTDTKSELIARISNASNSLNETELEQFVIQLEAIAASK